MLWLLAVVLGSADFVDARTAYATKTYALTEGLPDTNVQAIAIDGKGRLYVGTQDGVAYFDAKRWTVLPFASPTTSRFINCLGVDNEGGLWAGTQASGLQRWYDGQWHEIALKVDGETSPPTRVTALAISSGSDATMWVGTAEGLLTSGDLGKSWRRWSKAKLPNESVSVVVPFGDDVAIGTKGGLLWFHEGRGEVFTTKDGLPDNEIRSVARLGDALWVGSESGLASISPGGQRARTWPSFAGAPVSAIVVRGDSLWVGSYGKGLALWTGTNFREFVAPLYLPNGFVRSLLIDVAPDGAPLVWIGNDAGITRLHYGGFRRLVDGPADVVAKKPTALAEFGSGADRAFVLGVENALTSLSARGWQRHVLPGARDDTVYSVATSSTGLLLGTLDGFLFRTRDLKTFEKIAAPTHSVKNSVWSIRVEATPAGEVWWLGRRTSFERFDGKTWTVLGGDLGLQSLWTWAFGRHPVRNGLWLGTQVGAALYESGRAQALDASKGFPGEMALTFLPRTDSEMWIGTAGGGIVVTDPARLKPIKTLSTASSPPLPNGYVYQLQQADRETVFAFTNQGVQRIRVGDPFEVQSFGVDDGLASLESAHGVSLIDSTRRLWVPTGGGVSVRALDDFAGEPVAKPLVIERVLMNKAPTDVARIADLRYNENNLRFEYALLSMFREGETRFRSQLIGLEAQPGDWSEQPSREFTTLPSGSYQLSVWAKNYAGSVTGPVVVPFTVHPAPWVTWWAILSYVVVGVSSVYGGVRWRLAAMRQRAEELEKKIADRTIEIRLKATELEGKNNELSDKNSKLEEAHRAADRIFNALAQALTGTVLDEKYRLDEKIGEGGFGAVFRANRLADGILVAVKVFKPQPGNDSAESLRRFQLEAKSASLIQHPHAIQVLDSGVSKDGVAYMAMELLRGKSLKQLLAECTKLPVQRSLQIAIDVSSALEAAHGIGVIHRDIKPDNIFLQELDGGGQWVKVLDFGVAKITSPTQSMNLQSLTITGAIVGTPAYMAPERLATDEYDGRSDIYSLGIVLYEMLVGRLPFESNTSNVFSLVMMHMNQAPPPLTQFDPSLDPRAQKVVMVALEKEPVNRPTAVAYTELLSGALTEIANPAS